jgi:hypothetical protein
VLQPKNTKQKEAIFSALFFDLVDHTTHSVRLYFYYYEHQFQRGVPAAVDFVAQLLISGCSPHIC